MAATKRPFLSFAELEALTPETVDESLALKIAAQYAETKVIGIRKICLRLLYDKPFAFLEEFFDRALRKERYLDMRVAALRGLAQFTDESALTATFSQMNETLRKLAVSTPYNYQEYECLLGRNALPYLRDRYGYACVAKTLALVQANYDAMPEAFKGHFTIGEDGKLIQLRSSEESRRMLNEFFAAKRAR